MTKEEEEGDGRTAKEGEGRKGKTRARNCDVSEVLLHIIHKRPAPVVRLVPEFDGQGQGKTIDTSVGVIGEEGNVSVKSFGVDVSVSSFLLFVFVFLVDVFCRCSS